MQHNDVTQRIVDAAIQVHRRLGPGLLESVYERVLAYEIERRGLRVNRQVPIEVVYDGLRFDEGFRADLIVQDMVIVELKSVEVIKAVHRKQLRTYLALADMRVELLLNFGQELLKDGIVRAVNNLPEA